MNFEQWWATQPLSKDQSPGFVIIAKSYKEIAQKAWDAGQAQVAISMCTMDAKPTFQQGMPTSEVQDLVEAKDMTEMVERMAQLITALNYWLPDESIMYEKIPSTGQDLACKEHWDHWNKHITLLPKGLR